KCSELLAASIFSHASVPKEDSAIRVRHRMEHDIKLRDMGLDLFIVERPARSENRLDLTPRQLIQRISKREIRVTHNRSPFQHIGAFGCTGLDNRKITRCCSLRLTRR